MRTQIYKIVRDVNLYCVSNSLKMGVYPPRIEINKDKSLKELLVDLDTLSSFLRRPHFKYISKPVYKNVGKTALSRFE